MLTRKQYELLLFINDRLGEGGVSPSFDEMKDALGLKSKSGIHRLITGLEERGFIRRLPHRARALEVLKLPEGSEAGAGRQQRAAERAKFQPNVIKGDFSGALAGREVNHQVEAIELPLYGRIAAGTPIEALRDNSAMIGVPVNLGVALDTPESLVELTAGARNADLLVTSGGASAGEYDLVRSVLGDRGMELDFYKIAMRPGKPLMFGRLGEVPVLGLPGNPVSSYVCSVLFLRPALLRMQGLDPSERRLKARLAVSIKQNDQREDYMRASLSRSPDGDLIAKAFESQDSSLVTVLARADCLIIRPPFAPAASKDDAVEILPLSGGSFSL